MTSSIYPISITNPATGTVTAVSVVLGGTGYVQGESVTLTGAGTGATATVNVTAGAVTSVVMVLAGAGYISGETLQIVSALSGSGATGTATTTTIAADTNIFSSNLAITAPQVSPGGGAILRLLFAFALGTSPAVITVFNNGVIKGILNADNSNNIVIDGYYRFDIDVESGDSINIQSSEIIDVVRFTRAHLIQFGA